MPPIGLIILMLLIALPLLEIALLIKVGALIGVWATLAIIVGTFFGGIALVQHQGFGVARRMMQTARSGEPPLEPMMESMLLWFAGACLILPGLITDSIGLLLMIPPVRQAVAQWSVAKGFPMFARSARGGSTRRTPGEQRRRPGHGPTIEASYERLDEKTAKPGSEGKT
jgi:UPF0716 protein FxsA